MSPINVQSYSETYTSKSASRGPVVQFIFIDRELGGCSTEVDCDRCACSIIISAIYLGPAGRLAIAVLRR